MERSIDGAKNHEGLEARARGRGARARRLGAALAVLLAALTQQAVAQERQDLVLCEKLKRTGESKGVVLRAKEPGCVGKEQVIDLAAIHGLEDPPAPKPQSLQCVVRETRVFTDQPIQVDCAAGETVTGGGMTLSVEDRLEGELFESSQPVGNGWACDAGVASPVDATCFAICCSLTE